MKKILFLLLATLFVMQGWSQTVINESFEGSFPPTGWTNYSTAFTQSSTLAHTGTHSIGYAAASSSYPTYGIITPQFAGSTGQLLSFYIYTGGFYSSDSWYTSFRIKVSTTNNSVSSFSTIKEYCNYDYSGIHANKVILTEANFLGTWYECTADLSAYNGQQIYVAIEVYDHWGCEPNVQIDDILIVTPLANDLTAVGLSPYNMVTGQAQIPYFTFKNNGLTAVTSSDYTIQLTDGGSYTQTISGVDLAIGQDTTVAFPAYTAATLGAMTLTATITYAADLYVADNTITPVGQVYDLPVYDNNAYTLNASNGNYYSFDVYTSALTSVGTGISSTPFPMSETWVGDKIARVCSDGSFGYVLANGAFAKIGNLISPVEAQPVSLAYDRTNSILYVLGVDASDTAYLGTVDLTSLEVAAIGSTNNTQLIIGIDFAADGYLYGPAIGDNKLYKIDPSDATTTEIGNVGVDLNYGQDVAYDYVTNKLYSYAYVNSVGVKYGYYNLNTGAFIEIAPIAVDGQYACIIIITNTLLACDQVSGVTPSEITATTATVSWFPPESIPSNGYEYYLSTSATAPTADSIATGTESDTVVYLQDLTPNTPYYIWVRSNCGGEVSAWSNFVATFTTPCVAFTTLPFKETFEDTSASRNCWKIIDANGDGDAWTFYNSSTYAHGGTYSAQIYTDYNAGNNNDWLISPAITLSSTATLKYWYRARSTGEPDAFEVLVSTTGNQPADFTYTLLPSTEFNNITYQQTKIDLSAYVNSTIYIAWHVPQGGPDGWNINIDDIEVTDCEAPYNIQVSAETLTETSADILWSGASPSNTWNIAIYANATTTPTVNGGDIANGTVNTKNFSTAILTAESTYYVYIQSVCDTTWSSYTFTTPAACPTPTGLTVANINAVAGEVTLSWNALGATSWNIKVSSTVLTDPENETADIENEGAATGTPQFLVTGLTVGNYYCYVQSDCGGAWANGTIVLQYCTPNPTSVDYNGGIFHVTFGTLPMLDHATAPPSSAPFYNNNSNLIGGVVEGDTTFSISVTQGYVNGYITKIWVDWNKDLMLDDVTELVAGPSADVSGVQNFTATIPANTPLGSYRLRIGSHDGPIYGALIPCYVGTYGSYEDYTLKIVPVPLCLYPANLAVSNITASSATATWTAPEIAPANGYQVLVSTSATEPTGTEDEIQAITDTFLLIDNLDPLSSYYVWVRSDCGNEEYSIWMSVNFTTPCVAMAIPLVQNFDDPSYATGSGNFNIPCWNKVNTYNTSYPYLSTSYSTSAPNSLYHTVGGAGTYSLIVTPPLEMALNTLRTDFKVRNSNNYGRIDVLAIENINDPNTYTVVQTITLQNATQFISYTVDLTTYSGNANRIGYKYYSTSTYYSCYMDDITVRLPSIENDIVSFSFAEQTAPATIDALNHTVDIEVSYSTPSLNGLIPTIAVSPYATIAPASGIAQDFSSSFTYTVTSEMGTQQTWTVNVTQAATALSEKDIITFTLPSQTTPAIIDATEATVNINVNFLANLAALTPTITLSPFATIAPLSGTVQNFSNPVIYTVTAEDGTTKTWTVTVTNDSVPLGAACSNPIPLNINDPEAFALVNTASKQLWFAVTLNAEYTNVIFSTCGSTSDNKLFIVNNDCSQSPTYASHSSSGDYIYYNDDYNDANYTSICVDDYNQAGISATSANVYPAGTYTGNLSAGVYYVVITPYGATTSISSPYSLLVTGTSTTTCVAPTALNSTTLAPTAATITWTAGDAETEWQVAWKEAVASDWNNPVGVTATTYDISGLTAATDYNVRVRAICSANDTSTWTTHNFTTLAAPPCPAPTAVAATEIFDTATITWTPGGAETEWQVTWKEVAASAWNNPVGATAIPHGISGLAASTDYEVKVRAICGASDTSVWSDVATFTTLTCENPTNINPIAIDAHSITITWQPMNGEDEWMVSWTNTSTGQRGSGDAHDEQYNGYAITDLIAGTQYKICIVAVCAPGAESDSINCINVTTTGIQDVTLANSLQLYPNPTTGELKIKNYEFQEGDKIEIYNVLGQKQQLTTNHYPLTTINVSHLSAGIYTVKIGGYVGKFVKK